jgi:hypothetical protein
LILRSIRRRFGTISCMATRLFVQFSASRDTV